jgi:hypothetical protein
MGFAILDFRFAICGTIAKPRFPMNEAEVKNRTKQADESAYWMELVIDGGLLPKTKVDALRQEACELDGYYGVVAAFREWSPLNRKSKSKIANCLTIHTQRLHGIDARARRAAASRRTRPPRPMSMGRQ